MKAGKKIAAKAQKRGIHHANALQAKARKTGSSADLEKSMKAPGSRNKKKT